MAEAGFSSRRTAEEWIKRGQVRVNGKQVLTPGFKVDPSVDRIEVGGKLVEQGVRSKVFYLFHKPVGVVTTLRDAHADRTVSDYFKDVGERLFPAGRLDKDSSGLLLMTNDGELVHRLTHPRFGVKKSYLVTVDKDLSEQDLSRLRRGILLDGRKTAPCAISKMGSESGGRFCFRVMLHEGRKRQIRLMMSEVGAQVLLLHRDAYGPLSLGRLRAGEKRKLSEKEVEELRKQVFT